MKHRVTPLPAIALLLMVGLALVAAPAAAQDPVFMSAEWAVNACDAWNENETLTTELEKWIENDLDRGFKVMHIYRLDCEESPRIEMRIALEEGQTRCVYGGAVETEELDPDADYLMFAMTERWQEMGARRTSSTRPGGEGRTGSQSMGKQRHAGTR